VSNTGSQAPARKVTPSPGIAPAVSHGGEEEGLPFSSGVKYSTPGSGWRQQRLRRGGSGADGAGEQGACGEHIGAGARRDLGCSGRPLPAPAISRALWGKGCVTKPLSEHPFPSLPCFFPFLSLISELVGFPSSALSWRWGSPGPTHAAVSLAGAFLPTLPQFHFLGDLAGERRGSGLQRARVAGGAQGASCDRGSCETPQGLFGVLREEVRGMGTRPHVANGESDAIPKLSVHPDGFVGHPGGCPGRFHPCADPGAAANPARRSRSSSAQGCSPARCLGAGRGPADRIRPEGENQKENLVEQEPSPAAAAGVPSSSSPLLPGGNSQPCTERSRDAARRLLQPLS